MLVQALRPETRSPCCLGCRRRCWKSALLLGSGLAARGKLLGLVGDGGIGSRLVGMTVELLSS